MIETLTTRSDIQALFRNGNYFRSGAIAIRWSKNSEHKNRILYIVARKDRKKSAVRRNRIRRLGRAMVYSVMKHAALLKGIDLGIIIMPDIELYNHEKRCHLLSNILTHNNLLTEIK